MAIDLSKGENTVINITLRAMVVMVILIIGIYTWLLTTFVTKADAAEYNNQITAQMSGLTKEVRVSAAYARVDAQEAKIYALKRDGASETQLRNEGKTLTRATKYRDCLLENKPNCELLAKQIK